MAEYVIVNLSGELSDVERALFCTRIDKAYSDLRKQTTVIPEVLLQSHANERDSSVANDVVQKNTGDESKVIDCDPLYTFDRLILPEKTQKDLLNLIRLFEVKDKVFNQWNLRIVEPNPKVALANDLPALRRPCTHSREPPAYLDSQPRKPRAANAWNPPHSYHQLQRSSEHYL